MKHLQSLIRNRYLLAIVILVLIFTSAIVWNHFRLTTRSYYKSHLTQLQTEVSNIPLLTDTNESSVVKADKYISALAKIAQTCHELSDKTDETAKKAGRYQTAVSQTGKLCQDLLDVTNYSQAVYQSGRDYLTMDQNFLSAPSANDFASNVHQTVLILTKTKQTLEEINYPQINDPAQSELVSTVDSDLQLANQLEGAGGSAAAKTLADQLSTKLTRDKANFLNARVYYWDNTVGLDRLRQAINGLRDKFN